MKLKIFLPLLIGTFLGCEVNKKEIPGVYISKHQINNIDTLVILKNGTYKKNTYRKLDNSLIFVNSGSWKYKKGRITFKDFFYDSDKVYSKGFKDILITSSLIIKKEKGKMSIEFLEEKGYFRYQKL